MGGCLRAVTIVLVLFMVSSAATSKEAGEIAGSEFWPALFGYKIKISDSLLVLFTAVLAVFTGLLWWSTAKLWKAGEKQAVLTKQALISSQRAWISISLEADGDLDVTRQGIQLPVCLHVHNIGRSPALRTHTMMKMVMFSNRISSKLVELTEKEKMPNMTSSRLVLPDESYDRKWVPSMSRLEIEKDKIGSDIWPYIIGCVSYQVLGDDEVHQTAFVYSVGIGKDRETANFIPLKIGMYPQASLIVTVEAGGFAT